MKLDTKNLKIIPLSLPQFKLLLDGTDKMENSLGLNNSDECLDENTKQAMEGLYSDALKNSANYLWYTNWQIILKEANLSIGSACFMKAPDENGEIEIGYGINDSYQNKGYMTEAAKALCEWALNQEGVLSLIAETEKTNIASHKVLAKCGMIKYKENEESFWWRLNKSK